MSEKLKQNAPVIDEGEQYVTVELAVLDAKNNVPLVVSVNGEKIEIPRGKRVTIKRKMLWAIQNHLRQDMIAAQYIAVESFKR